MNGGARSLKSSFTVPFSETAERLDPPYYLLHRQARELLDPLTPLESRIKEKKKKFRPKTDAEMDADYNVFSVSNDGLVTLNMRVKGEDFKAMKRVQAGDVVYNPMRINVGSIGVVPAQLDSGLVSPDYVIFRSENLSPDFLITLLRSPFYRMYIDVTSTGSIRNRLYFGNLQQIRVPAVSGIEQAAICKIVGRADDKHEAMKRAAEDRARMVNRLNALVRAPAEEAGETAEAFRALAERWHRETGMLSSIARKVRHPAYQKIIAMGDEAVPLILREMQGRPGHWFAALKAITGASPLPDGDKADVRRATEAWIEWGKQRGLIKQEEKRADEVAPGA